MGFLIDSNVFIEAERGRFAFDDFLEANAGETFAIAAITASELLHGVHRANKVEIANKRRLFVEDILEKFPVLPFDLAIARIHAQIWATLQHEGKLIGANNLLIAATGLCSGFGVITLNQREFDRVPGLTVLNPVL